MATPGASCYHTGMTVIRTLVVDDSPEFLKIIQRYIEHFPQLELVGEAVTGEAAVQQAQALNPDLVLLDLVLPGINGIEAARQIKAFLPRTVVALLTLYDLQEYRAEAEAAGVDELIHKSTLSDEWVAALVEQITGKIKKPSILVVDDSATIRRMVITALRPLQAEVGEASTGLEAIEQLALKAYDVMTLDLNMPDMHGVEVLEFLRSSERYRNLPVIVLTTRGDEDSRAIAIQLGANGYLTKPFRPDELLKAVKGLLPL